MKPPASRSHSRVALASSKVNSKAAVVELVGPEGPDVIVGGPAAAQASVAVKARARTQIAGSR